MKMKFLCLFLVLVTCYGVWAQPDIVGSISDPDSASEDSPPGDAAPEASGGSSRHAGGSWFGWNPKCPNYLYDPYVVKCSSKRCPVKRRCYYKVTTGYYCGMPFSVAKPFYVNGVECTNHVCDYSGWQRCTCGPKFCWFAIKRVISHHGKYYFLKLWFARPCDCECQKKRH